MATEFGHKGDWRMKWATYVPGHPEAHNGWLIPGASWGGGHHTGCRYRNRQKRSNNYLGFY